MKKVLFFVSMFLFLTCSYSQKRESSPSESKKPQLKQLSGGFGFGILKKNHHWVWDTKVLFSNNWGFSFDVRHRRDPAINTPIDYFGGFCLGGCKEFDYYTILSGLAIKDWDIPGTRFITIGIETGPSYNYWAKTYFTSNPDFQPNSFEDFTPSHKTHISSSSNFGWTTRLKVEFPLLISLGLEMGLITNFSPLQNMAGFEIILNGGKIRGSLN